MSKPKNQKGVFFYAHPVYCGHPNQNNSINIFLTFISFKSYHNISSAEMGQAQTNKQAMTANQKSQRRQLCHLKSNIRKKTFSCLGLILADTKSPKCPISMFQNLEISQIQAPNLILLLALKKV